MTYKGELTCQKRPTKETYKREKRPNIKDRVQFLTTVILMEALGSGLRAYGLWFRVWFRYQCPSRRPSTRATASEPLNSYITSFYMSKETYKRDLQRENRPNIIPVPIVEALGPPRAAIGKTKIFVARQRDNLALLHIIY
jgi:hypothetical protein